MKKEWFSAAELAGLPGVPGTEQGMRKAADREQWHSRKRLGRGGGNEYHLSALPADTQKAIRAEQARAAASERSQQAEITSQTERLAALESAGAAFAEQQQNEDEAAYKARLKHREMAAAEFAALPEGEKKQRAKAREFTLLHGYQFMRDQGLNKTQGINTFCLAVKNDEISLPAWVRQELPHHHGVTTLDKATFNRWQKAYRESGRMGLVDGYGNRKGQSKIETTPELKRVVLGALLKYPHITAKKIRAYLEAAHAELNIVSIKTIDRYLKGWKEENAQLWIYMTNPDQWKNTYMAAAGSHFERIERLNQVWEMDSTPGDWMLTDGRHSVLGVIDLYSRRLKLYVSKTSKAMAVCQVFRRAVLSWGVAEAVRTDNGKDYVANQFNGVLRDLEVGHEVCVPFASEEKGTIERTLQTMSHGVLDLLPGFIGHNVAERKVIEARKSFAQRIMTPGETVEVAISSEQLQEMLDQWADHVYAHDDHSGLNGKSPWQVASEWTGPIRRISNERALDLLLAEVAGTRTITKKGIRFESRDYFDQALFEYVGKEATVKYDEQDLGRLAVYIDGAFICWATNHELAGTSRKEAAVASKAHQKKFLAAQSQEFKQFKRDLKEDLPQVILQHRIAQSEKLTAFPPRAEEYSTSGLTAASRAAGRQPERQEPDDKTKAMQQQIASDLQQPVVKHINQFESPKERYARWARIERQIENGEPVNSELKEQLKRYMKGDEYRSMKSFFEDFGLAIEEAN